MEGSPRSRPTAQTSARASALGPGSPAPGSSVQSTALLSQPGRPRRGRPLAGTADHGAPSWEGHADAPGPPALLTGPAWSPAPPPQARGRQARGSLPARKQWVWPDAGFIRRPARGKEVGAHADGGVASRGSWRPCSRAKLPPRVREPPVPAVALPSLSAHPVPLKKGSFSDSLP